MTQQEEQDMKHGWGSVILSGGQGRRMGGIDKGGLDYKGESFCGHIQKQLQALDIPCYLSRACYAGSGGRESGQKESGLAPWAVYGPAFSAQDLMGCSLCPVICLYSGKRWRLF